jgi:adenosylcobinamide-GDP ribazoletransferase
MGALRILKDLLTFLTIIPVPMDQDTLGNAAEFMYLFPLVGGLIGALSGLAAIAMFQWLPSLIAAFLTLSFTLLLTGLHHMDGLLDVGDGLMCYGSAEKKLQAMHDVNTGVGGATLGLLVVILTGACIAYIPSQILFFAIVASEISAKLAMVAAATFGEVVAGSSGAPFVKAMKGREFLVVSFALSALMCIPGLLLLGVLVPLVGAVAGLTVAWIANRHFKGVTGDVFGATNELARLACLIFVLALSKYPALY